MFLFSHRGGMGREEEIYLGFHTPLQYESVNVVKHWVIYIIHLKNDHKKPQKHKRTAWWLSNDSEVMLLEMINFSLYTGYKTMEDDEM